MKTSVQRMVVFFIFLLLVSGMTGYGAAQSPQYRADIRHGHGKYFQAEVFRTKGAHTVIDIYLSHVFSCQNQGGVWVDFSGSVDKLHYVSAGRAFTDGSEGIVGPWSPWGGALVNEPLGEGTLMMVVTGLGGECPDADGDLIVGWIEVECIGEGDATITLTTIPGCATWTPLHDDLVIPGPIVIHQSDMDNCPNHHNPDQADSYPPQGNYIGDACDCEGNFDCDQDVDAADVAAFLQHFDRSHYNRPCTNVDPCKGDFSCDGDVDAMDVAKFREDFGRNQYNNLCPVCEAGIPWCVY